MADIVKKAAAPVAPGPDPQVLARFADMAAMLPTASGDGTSEIVDLILSADAWDNLDDAWTSAGLTDLLGQVIVIDGAKVLPSSYAGGLGVFLVVNARNETDDSPIVFTTSSAAIVAQIVKAYVSGWLPIKVVPVQAERPSANGYYPQHLQVVGKAAPKA